MIITKKERDKIVRSTIREKEECKNVIRFLDIINTPVEKRKKKDNLWLMYNQYHKYSLPVNEIRERIREIENNDRN